jgi:YD repeat-containing protein
MKAIITAAMLITAAPAFAQNTMQRDAPTTRFYDARGNVTGSASTYGNVTKFYAPDGKLIGSATAWS